MLSAYGRRLKNENCSGVGVCVSQTSVGHAGFEVSDIRFRELVEAEIQAYIGKYEVLRYAGAFESDAVLFFADRISGSYNFVTALPVSRLIVFLREQGMTV